MWWCANMSTCAAWRADRTTCSTRRRLIEAEGGQASLDAGHAWLANKAIARDGGSSRPRVAKRA